MALAGPGMADLPSVDHVQHLPPDARESWPATSVAGPFNFFQLPRSVRHGVAKTAWRHRSELAEDVGEISLIGKPLRPRDLPDGQIRPGQQSLRALDPHAQHIFVGRSAHGPAE